jgi:hypothetical protein
MRNQTSNSDVKSKTFQLWADSFHEGEWACRAIGSQIEMMSGQFQVEYINGFLPEFRYHLSDQEFTINVYGNYASWSPQPEELTRLLAWGKPDLVLIEEDTQKIILAVEETAATPTGNQALQRCERQYGSSKEGFPFWYLIAEFGIHTDGGIRRDSIWPTLMGLETMSSLNIPSIVLHYSDLENPEDYTSGFGMSSLFRIISSVLINVVNEYPALRGLEEELTKQILAMEDFVKQSWKSSLYLLPDISDFDATELSKQLCMDSPESTKLKHRQFLNWPLAIELDQVQQKEQTARELIKYDAFAEVLEDDLAEGKCYGIIKGSGSKPLASESLRRWINEQNTKQKNWEKASKIIGDTHLLSLDDFPLSPSGRRHVITAPRILYLYDKQSDVEFALKFAFPRLKEKTIFDEFERKTEPSLVFISNSVKPGRIFGDPYTGQISAYSVSFGALSKTRSIVAYFPHQSIAQAAQYLVNPNNKGLRILAELTDLLVFSGGYAIKTKSLEIV